MLNRIKTIINPASMGLLHTANYTGTNKCTISMDNCMTKCTKKVQCIVEYAAT